MCCKRLSNLPSYAVFARTLSFIERQRPIGIVIIGVLRKVLKKSNELKQAGTTIVFISHDLGAIKCVCDRVLLLLRGEVITDLYGCISKDKIND
jgi:ABC-type Na+ transport system ATPase subunit NatA